MVSHVSPESTTNVRGNKGRESRNSRKHLVDWAKIEGSKLTGPGWMLGDLPKRVLEAGLAPIIVAGRGAWRTLELAPCDWTGAAGQILWQSVSDLVEVARSFQPLIREHADAADEARAPAASVIAAMADAGLFRAGTPASTAAVRLTRSPSSRSPSAVAEADGATGWVLMVGLEAALAIAFMEPAAARSIMTSCPNLVMCVSIAPNGSARPVDGGFVVSGRWQYVSGCTVADYFLGGCLIVDDDGQPQRTVEGAPLMRQVIVPRAEYTIDPTWRAAGLTGTGSHDVVLTNAVVPTDMTLNIYAGPRVDAAPYRLPLSLRLALQQSRRRYRHRPQRPVALRHARRPEDTDRIPSGATRAPASAAGTR